MIEGVLLPGVALSGAGNFVRRFLSIRPGPGLSGTSLRAYRTFASAGVMTCRPHVQKSELAAPAPLRISQFGPRPSTTVL